MAKPHESLEKHDLLDRHPWVRSDYEDRADRSVNIWQTLSMIKESLQQYQSFHQIPKKWEPYTVLFPYSRYLDPGDTVINVTQSITYNVESVLWQVYNKLEGSASFRDKEVYDLKSGEMWCYSGQKVVLSGSNAPDKHDLLLIEPKELGEFSGQLIVGNLIDMLAAYPNQQQDADPWRDLITYRIIRRQLGGGKQPFSGPIQYKPQLRATYTDIQEPTKKFNVFSQWYDNDVQFDCWTKTSTEADQLMAYFDDFMRKHRWVWRRNGVVQILYGQQYRDTEVTKWRNDITERSVKYFIRTEYLDTEETTVFTDIRTGLYGLPVSSGVYGWTVPTYLRIVEDNEDVQEIPYWHLIT
jgi:hypothetical protein